MSHHNNWNRGVAIEREWRRPRLRVRAISETVERIGYFDAFTPAYYEDLDARRANRPILVEHERSRRSASWHDRAGMPPISRAVSDASFTTPFGVEGASLKISQAGIIADWKCEAGAIVHAGLLEHYFFLSIKSKRALMIRSLSSAGALGAATATGVLCLCAMLREVDQKDLRGRLARAPWIQCQNRVDTQRGDGLARSCPLQHKSTFRPGAIGEAGIGASVDRRGDGASRQCRSIRPADEMQARDGLQARHRLGFAFAAACFASAGAAPTRRRRRYRPSIHHRARYRDRAVSPSPIFRARRRLSARRARR